MPHVALRPLSDADLDTVFEQMREPESVRMAAFTSADPDDRRAFDLHTAMIRTSPDMNLLAIISEDHLVGTVGSWTADGVTEVTYWVARQWWGQGIASAALALHLEDIAVRPVQARVASDNAASLRVLQKAGFRPVGTEVAFAAARGAEIEETILELP